MSVRNACAMPCCLSSSVSCSRLAGSKRVTTLPSARSHPSQPPSRSAASHGASSHRATTAARRSAYSRIRTPGVASLGCRRNSGRAASRSTASDAGTTWYTSVRMGSRSVIALHSDRSSCRRLPSTDGVANIASQSRQNGKREL
eukprot:3288877-Prymnesium_polylepis.2